MDWPKEYDRACRAAAAKFYPGKGYSRADLHQEAAIRLLKVEPPTTEPALCRTVAQRAVIDFLRSHGTFTRAGCRRHFSTTSVETLPPSWENDSPVGVAPDIADEVVDRELDCERLRRVRQHITGRPGKKWHALRLWLAGVPTERAAREVGTSVESYYVHLTHARQDLRREAVRHAW